MLILNFTHPLTNDHLVQIEKFVHSPVEDVRTIPVQIEQSEPLAEQIENIINSVNLKPDEWQTRPILINPPGYAPAAFVLMAELHGRMGHFPTFIRMRPKQGPVTSFEVAELLNLQTVREEARKRR